jgi:ketosteroid isomerase-like protein
MTNANEDPVVAVERLVRVTNAHDIEGIVECFADDYVLDSPIHPQRSFRGKEQVRRNWTQILAAVPDIAVRVLRSARDGNTAWTEWEMNGTRRDGVAHLMRGVFIFGVSGGLVRWGRMFLEPVDPT